MRPWQSRSTGEAQNAASSAELRATLQTLYSWIGNRSQAAHQVGANPINSLGTAVWVKAALEATATTALGPSKPNQVHWAGAGQIMGAPTIHAAASADLGLWSLKSQDWLAGSQIQLATQGASRVHIEQGGRKAFISEGNAETIVSKGRLHVLVEGNISIQSHSGAISLKAGGSSIKLTADGHLGMKSSGSSVMQTSLHQIRAGAVMVQGGSVAQVPGALKHHGLHANSWVEINHHYEDLEPIQGAPFELVYPDGQVFKGQLDAQGYAKVLGVPSGVGKLSLGEDSRSWQGQAPSNPYADQAGGREPAQRLIQDLLGSQP